MYLHQKEGGTKKLKKRSTTRRRRGGRPDRIRRGGAGPGGVVDGLLEAGELMKGLGTPAEELVPCPGLATPQ